jgi:2-polyprenyl-3-methyl-5-hydroxy-6-metoxy-1,4-benzoquinol methylase
MALIYDPEGVEPAALFDIVDLRDKNVLEIGCGDGRLTWRYATQAGHVTALDSDRSEIEIAMEERPAELKHSVEFILGNILALEIKRKFDVILFSWSL